MKTIEELIKQIEGSVELQKELKEIKDKEEFLSFLKKNDCDATVDEYIKYVESHNEGILSDDDAENVAGGLPYWWPLSPTIRKLLEEQKSCEQQTDQSADT